MTQFNTPAAAYQKQIDDLCADNERLQAEVERLKCFEEMAEEIDT